MSSFKQAMSWLEWAAGGDDQYVVVNAEIERLRGELQAHQDSNAYIECELKARIEELEEASVKEVLEFGVEQMSRGHDKYYIFDNEMINAAWIATCLSESGRGILRIFHIHECEGCGGEGRAMRPIGEHFVTREMAIDGGDPQLEGMSMGIEYEECECPDCDGKGWVIGGEDE